MIKPYTCENGTTTILTYYNIRCQDCAALFVESRSSHATPYVCVRCPACRKKKTATQEHV
jgi:phage FluMu protein Com